MDKSWDLLNKKISNRFKNRADSPYRTRKAIEWTIMRIGSLIRVPPISNVLMPLCVLQSWGDQSLLRAFQLFYGPHHALL